MVLDVTESLGDTETHPTKSSPRRRYHGAHRPARRVKSWGGRLGDRLKHLPTSETHSRPSCLYLCFAKSVQIPICGINIAADLHDAAIR
jgi:hypothetical protein